MINLIKSLISYIKPTKVKTLPFAEIEALHLITILNVNYLKAHITTSNALMNSYPKRSLKRKDMQKRIDKMEKQLIEQEYDKEIYSRMMEARPTSNKN